VSALTLWHSPVSSLEYARPDRRAPGPPRGTRHNAHPRRAPSRPRRICRPWPTLPCRNHSRAHDTPYASWSQSHFQRISHFGWRASTTPREVSVRRSACGCDARLDRGPASWQPGGPAALAPPSARIALSIPARLHHSALVLLLGLHTPSISHERRALASALERAPIPRPLSPKLLPPQASRAQARPVPNPCPRATLAPPSLTRRRCFPHSS